MTQPSVVLSALEFDVAWESEGLGRRHVAVDVPSPGRTHAERAELADAAWESMRRRGLARGRRVTGDVADRLGALANYTSAFDCWVWTDRQISALAVTGNGYALLAVVDGDEVWLIPLRETALAQAAVSVAGELAAGEGRSVRVPNDALRRADEDAGGDPEKLVTRLEARGLALVEAQILASMFVDMRVRGQFGAQRRGRDGVVHRADRVVCFHDNPTGRFVYLMRPAADGVVWATVTPADNQRLAECLRELADEL